MMVKSRSWLKGCIISLAVSAIIVWAGGYLLGENAQVLFFIVPVVAASSGGLVAGLFATVLSAVLGTYFFIEHSGLHIPDPADRIRIATFVIVGGLISWLIESLHGARRHLEDRQRQLERQQELLAAEMHHREEAQTALREKEERIRMAVESANIGTWDLNVLTGERKWSDRSRAMFGLALDEELSRASFLEFLHPDDRDPTGHAIQAALDPNGTGSYESEYRAVWPDGTTRWIIAKGQAFFEGEAPNRHAVRFIGTAFDITERKKMEQTLKEADRRKDEFLATLAHELRNPLTPISNSLQLWPSVENDRAEMEKIREMMERQVDQITRLIDDLMDVSRITRGKIELHKQPVDLGTLLQGAIESIQPYLEAYGHQLTVMLPSEPVLVDGDVARLTQVFGNVLNNAAKYTGRNGVIWASASRQGDSAVVSIRDNGPGIPQQMLSDIFEMFRQVDGTLNRSHGGLGIGLTLVKQLVELHGGTVEARCEGPGKGSEFVVTLPALAAQSNTPPGHRLKQLNVLPRRRILVVDDIQASADTLAMLLRGMGQDVAVAHNGRTAIDWALENKPEAVFLDIAMPDMNGYEVARRLRGFSETATTVLVALTGYGQESDRRQAFEAGFNHHMVKPPSMDALEDVLLAVPAFGL